jgi:hypothetical protein
MFEHVKGFIKELWAWWNSDALSSKSIRVPFKLAVVGALAVIVLAAGLYGAGKLLAYAGDDLPVTQAQFTAFSTKMIDACTSPAKVDPVKKASKRK